MRTVLLKWLRGVTVIGALAYFAALLYWSYPYLKARLSPGGRALEDLSNEIEDWPEADALRESLERKFEAFKPEELKEHRPRVSLDGTHLLTPLVEASFLVSARPVEEPEPAARPEQPAEGAVAAEGPEAAKEPEPAKETELAFEYSMLDVAIRVDRLIWAVAILAGIVLLARDLWKEPVGGPPPVSEEKKLDLQGDLPNLLYGEARHYERLCNLTYARTTLLLRAAFVTALGGLGALFLLPANAQAADSSNDLWILLTRSYGVVLVVNAVALVFLRQYRSSAEDFRYMVNLRWRRMSTLAASLDVGKRDEITKALLAEAYPEEHLKKGSAAETKDGEKDDDLRSLLKKVLQSKEEK